MKLSIIIIFWDKDYKKAERVYTQIKERVSFKDYEIITIDNREETNEKLIFEPTFSFGYNARQLAARKKSLEFVKGEYVWFVDADDEVLGLDEFDYTEDCVIFDAFFYRRTKKENIFYKYDEDLFLFKNKVSIEHIDYKNVLALWNKITKTEKMKEAYSFLPEDKKIIFFEDCFICFCLDEICKEKVLVNKCIYKYNIGYANEEAIRSIEHFKNLSTGYLDMKKIILEKKPQFLEYFNMTSYWLIDKIYRTADLNLKKECIKIAETLFDGKLLEDLKCWSPEWVKDAKKPIQTKTFIKREYNFKDKGLSVIALLYDGNINYYESFIDNFLKNFFIEVEDLEIIVVDNREKTKDIKLKEYKKVKIIDAGSNIGILAGKKLGLKNTEKKLIWFIDLDDYVYNANFYKLADSINKDAEIISFGFLTENSNLIYHPAKLTRLNNVKIDNFFGCYGGSTFNKWFSRDFLIKCFEDINDDFTLILEDSIILCSAYKNNGNILFLDDILYNHRKNENSITLKNKTVDNYEALFKGFKNGKEQLKRICSKEVFETIYAFSGKYYLDLILKEKNTNEYFKIWLDNFGTESLQYLEKKMKYYNSWEQYKKTLNNVGIKL